MYLEHTSDSGWSIYIQGQSVWITSYTMEHILHLPFFSKFGLPNKLIQLFK